MRRKGKAKVQHKLRGSSDRYGTMGEPIWSVVCLVDVKLLCTELSLMTSTATVFFYI